MSLPSQSARSGVGSRAYTRPRRRGPISPRGAAAIAVALIGGSALLAWWAWPDGKKDSPVGEPISMHTLSPEAQTPTPEPARPEPAPVEIRMGQGIDEGGLKPLAASDRVPAADERASSPVAHQAGESLAKPATAIPAATPSDDVAASGAVRTLADEAKQASDPVKARALYSRALRTGSLAEADADAVRRLAASLNDDLVFSSRVAPGDELSAAYAVQSGDSLVRIAAKNTPSVDWRFIQRVNKIADPHKIRVGQKLKVVKGPFHAVVTKSAYRMDLYAGEGDSAVYIRSFAVGLGESDGTPVGTFIVKPGSKLINPHWVNPRTGEAFNADDPRNPIGERWLGLEGQGSTAGVDGYGIHGTIDPGSVGQQRSMGCIRLNAADIEVVYEMLGEGVSRVEIRP